MDEHPCETKCGTMIKHTRYDLRHRRSKARFCSPECRNKIVLANRKKVFLAKAKVDEKPPLDALLFLDNKCKPIL